MPKKGYKRYKAGKGKWFEKRYVTSEEVEKARDVGKFTGFRASKLTAGQQAEALASMPRQKKGESLAAYARRVRKHREAQRAKDR